ncbi:MAG: ABC transporter ATP-binding protein [Nitrososphaerota archaeon]
MLQVRDLVAGYGDIPIIRKVSLTAEAGEITTIIGPNGAGKSTLLKAIFNLVKPMAGRIYVGGEDITGLPSNELVMKGVSFLMQRRTVFPELTVGENLEMALWKNRDRKGDSSKTLEMVYDMFPALASFRKKQAYLLSGGEQRMVELARIIVQKPRLALVDEPTVGLSPKVALNIYKTLMKLKERGTAILMVDQNVRHAIEVSDKLYVMVNGTVTMEGSGKALSASLRDIVASWLKYT